LIGTILAIWFFCFVSMYLIWNYMVSEEEEYYRQLKEEEE